ncbi:MAG: hypothetical protein KDI74_18875, partial [Gammaproteobacteria bacterium]|nr:hypothetical protein [Gammaproteobacteria bacterium]
TNATYTGTVRDATTDSALGGVSLSINGSNLVSDASGSFSVSLPCGRYRLTVDVPAGYIDYDRTIDTFDGTVIDVGLTRESTQNGTVTESAIYGDPVNTATGNYVYQRRDLDIKGIGMPLRFDRTYNSRAAAGDDAIDGPLGYGWSHTFDVSLALDAGVVTITWGDGKTQTWSPDGMGGFIPQYGVFDDLIDDGGGAFTLQKRDD